MESVLISIITLSVLVILSSIIGFSKGNSSKAFDVVKFVMHSILFLFITAIWFSSIYNLQGLTSTNRLIPLISLYIVGITILTNLIISLTSAFIERLNQKLILTHKYSTFIMTISVLTGIISLILMD